MKEFLLEPSPSNLSEIAAFFQTRYVDYSPIELMQVQSETIAFQKAKTAYFTNLSKLDHSLSEIFGKGSMRREIQEVHKSHPTPLKGILKNRNLKSSTKQERQTQIIDKVVQLWDDAKHLRSSAIQNNNARLYEIDPKLVGESRWGNSWVPNIFKYVGSVFLSWWNKEEIKALEVANIVLNQSAFTQDFESEKKWGSAAVQAFDHSIITDSDREKVNELTKTLGEILILRISWADSKQKDLYEERCFTLSKSEKMEKKQINFEVGRQRFHYLQQRYSGEMEDDPRRKTGIFAKES
ncbi:hypothetical protein [Simkania sp.]|uniref:hypothetical protein n=1 Tax=Simkania sp. TaxID=34094 RepID=UPI003B52FA63